MSFQQTFLKSLLQNHHQGDDCCLVFSCDGEILATLKDLPCDTDCTFTVKGQNRCRDRKVRLLVKSDGIIYQTKDHFNSCGNRLTLKFHHGQGPVQIGFVVRGGLWGATPMAILPKNRQNYLWSYS